MEAGGSFPRSQVPATGHILSQMNPVFTLMTYLFNRRINDTSSMPKLHMPFFTSPTRAIYPLDFITRTNSILLWGHAVAQLVEALCYKPEGRGSIPHEIIGFFQFI
jgi:hypothetical protein